MGTHDDPYYALGPVTHGLEILGARDGAELDRLGYDRVYSDHLRDIGGDPVVDVYHARVVFPTPMQLPHGWTMTAVPTASRRRNLPHAYMASEQIAPWADEFAMLCAYTRRKGLQDVRRLANEARARLWLLSADDEDNIESAGGRVHGGTGYDARGRVIARGTAARPRLADPTGRRQAIQGGWFDSAW